MKDVCTLNQNIIDKFKTPLEFTLATLLPVFGWLYILYSMYEAVKIYLKHRGVTK